MQEIISKLAAFKVIPVIQISSLDLVAPLAEQLILNGLPVAEVTLRSEVAMKALEIFATDFPELLLIAGTVTSAEQAQSVLNAGAQMIVSPGFNRRTVEWCVDNGHKIIPGAMTPGEMEQAMDLGLNMIKFFPAEAAGGVPFLKSVASPYQALKIMPTGGIKPSNIKEYLALSNVVCCGGSWMVDLKLMAEHEWTRIGSLIKESRALTA